MTPEEEVRRRIRGEAPPVTREEALAMLTGRAPADAEAQYTDSLRRRDNDGTRKPAGRCPDTVAGDHGPADAQGICPWCGARYTHVSPAPPGQPVLGEIEAAYRTVYDPDYWE